jgi:hypothetical protein
MKKQSNPPPPTTRPAGPPAPPPPEPSGLCRRLAGAQGRWEQHLVNAQVWVNRAVFLMNARHNAGRHPYSLLTLEELSDQAIMHHIAEAIDDLKKALARIDPQERLF